MDAVKKFSSTIVSSLKIRNFRLYFFGHVVSMSGSWMQTVALGWLVLELTHSGTQLGIVMAMQFIPLLVFGPWGGLFADRYNKRKILYVTQSSLFFLVFVLGLLVYTHTVTLWMLYIFSIGLGVIKIFDNPAYQTFVIELVGDENIKNAVSLNAIGANLARVIGPALGGALIATMGISFSFFFNACSYLGTVLMLVLMHPDELHIVPKNEIRKGQLQEGFRYVMETPLIRSTLVMMAFIGTFSYEFQVSLPLMAERVFNGDARSYAALLSALGTGAVVGGLISAGRQKIVPHHLTDLAILFGISLVGTALMPTIHYAIVGMCFVGFFSINLTSLGNTMLQLESLPHMRGRVLALWSMAMIGSTAIGGPIIGVIGQYFGGRWGLGVGGIVAIVVAMFISRTLLKDRFYRFIPSWLQREPIPD